MLDLYEHEKVIDQGLGDVSIINLPYTEKE